MSTPKIKGTSNGGSNTNSFKPKEILFPDLDDISQIDSSSVYLFKAIVSAKNLGQQVDCLKDLMKNLSEDKFQITAIVLVQWYFTSGLKSGFRKVIANCLSAIKDDKFASLVTEQISVHIRKVCADDNGARGEAVKRILLAFDNFALGECGILAESETVIRFLTTRLQDQVENVCEGDVSPVDKAAQTEEAGESVRALVHLVKGNSDKPEAIACVSNLVYRILCQAELPLDLRSNCGHIYVLIEKSKGMEKVIQCIDDISRTGSSEDSSFCFSKPGSVLALLHGCVSSLSKEEISKAQNNGNLLGNVLAIYMKISNQDKETQSTLGHSRGLLNWSMKFLEYCKTDNSGAFVSKCQKNLFEYIWNHLEHPVDSVKHNTKNFLNNLILALVAGEASEQVDQLLADTIALPKHNKARIVALSCMVRSYDVLKVVDLYPSIQTDILSLSSEYALIGQISDLYDNILSSLFKTKSALGIWFENCVRPLIELYSSKETQGVTQLVTSLLKKCVKLDKKVIDLILADGNSSNKLALCCLKMGRDLAQEWDFTTHETLIRATSTDFSEEIRLQAFALCIESHSTVEIFAEPELKLLMDFITCHLTLQSPSSQQVFTGLVKKLLKRLYDGASAMCKKLTQKKFEKEFKKFDSCIVYYNTSLQNLVLTMFSNLFPGANPSRRSTVLDILSNITTIVGFKPSLNRIDISSTITHGTANSLLSCLHDSYENNKEKALGILKTLPPTSLNLHSPNHVSDLLDECFSLMTSSKPPDSITACYFIKFLLTAPSLPWVVADRLSLVTSKPETVKFMLAVYIRNRLVEQLSCAETSLLDAAADGPMYGTIAALRTVHEELRREEYTEEWEHLTKDIISVCYNVWRLVSSVVASDSPEGHLPMDQDTEGRQRLQRVMKQSLGNKSDFTDCKKDESFDLYCAVFNQVVVSHVFPDEIAEEIVDELVDDILGESKTKSIKEGETEPELKSLEKRLSESVISEEKILSPGEDLSESGLTKAREVSSQMLLLCAWRSVKEISLFLGDLCKTFSTTGSNIVTSEQILDIASFLMDLLSETKHRGAFEQAYVAFHTLCSSLWQSSHGELHSHPHQLLDDILYSINEGKKGAKSSLCATRRSAGVPFIVQAVVSTEVDQTGSVFRSTMQTLLNLAGDQAADAESRVHSLNILRALYRDSKLGDLVTTFIEQGVKVAIVGFKASNWAERNAATLLFSALITRIFGVKREKDTLSNKNCLTGKVFFQRYPSLYQFFLDQFEEFPSLSSYPKNAGVLVLDSALYPILLMLSRIFPSPSELMNNPFQLSAFLPFVRKCTGSSILQTRQLAASALVPLVAYEKVDLYVSDLVKEIGCEKLPQNILHGMLLQLKEFLDKFGALDNLLSEILVTNPLSDKLVKENPCSLTCAAYIALVNKVQDKTPNSECISYLQSILVEKLFDEKESSNADTALTLPSDIWKPLFFKHSARLIVKSSLAKEEISLAVKLLVHREYEVRQEVIELVTTHLVAGLKPEIPCQELMSLLFCEKHPVCLEKLLVCCSKLSKEHLLGDQIPFLLSLIESTDNDDIKSAGISLCSQMLSSVDASSLLSWALMIKDSLDSQNNFLVRQAAATAIVNNHFLLDLPKPDKIFERKACVLLWFSCLKLLLDDEPTLRDMGSILYEKFSGNRTNPSLACERLVELMLDKIGKRWPAAGLAVCACSVLSLMFEYGESEEMSAEIDKAFDKNEMNNFQEILNLAMLVLPPMGRLVRKLSPKMQEKAFTQDLPEDLMGAMLPDLPGAVTVYNMKQLLEYMASRACGDTGKMELLTMVLVFNSLRCKLSEDTFITFQNTQTQRFGVMKNKTCFEESVEQLGALKHQYG